MDSVDFSKPIWMPDDRMTDDGNTRVVDALGLFLSHLEEYHPENVSGFKSRMISDPDAALAEAVVFSWVDSLRLNPRVNESSSKGGVDFRCAPTAYSDFDLEVTTLDRDAVTNRSTLPDGILDGAYSFGMVTKNLRSKANAKTRQCANSDVPSMLAICSKHVHAFRLLGVDGAKRMMVSDCGISVPLELHGAQEGAHAHDVTDLARSSFLREKNGAIEPLRRSISAVLLISIHETAIQVVGLLHPCPAREFDHRTFGNIPFLKVDWPIVGNVIKPYWVIGDPPEKQFAFMAALPKKEQGQ